MHFVYSLVDGHLLPTSDAYLCVEVFSFLLGGYVGVKVLDCMEIYV